MIKPQIVDKLTMSQGTSFNKIFCKKIYCNYSIAACTEEKVECNTLFSLIFGKDKELSSENFLLCLIVY